MALFPRLLLVGMVLFPACKKGEDSGKQQDSTTDTDDTDDTDANDTGPGDFPADPTPFTLQTQGSMRESLVFDSPTCTYPVGSTSFRAMWRNTARQHYFVLIAEIMGDFTGPGTYAPPDFAASVKLQEEAGGKGRYFASDTNAGDTLSITVSGLTETQAWGEFEFSGLHDNGGATLTANPMPVPIWCPTLN